MGISEQPVVALSTTEAEYIALTAGCQEAIWAKNSLCDLGEPSCVPLVRIENKGGEYCYPKIMHFISGQNTSTSNTILSGNKSRPGSFE
jgi:hypothetical protein